MPNRFHLSQPGAGSPIPWLGWKYSLIFPVALLALAGSVAYGVVSSEPAPSTDVPGTTTALLPPTAIPTIAATTPPSTAERPSPPAVASVSPGSPAAPEPISATIEGVVTGANGDPLQGARITDGTTLAITGADGVFAISVDATGPDPHLQVSASGFHDWVHPVSGQERRMNIVLVPQPINALYLNPNMSGSDEEIQRIIDIINSTEANAVVIDIKEEIIYYDSEVPLFVDAGTIRPIMDLAALIQRFKDNDIYTIARLVVFKDGLVAQANPDMAVLNNVTGDLWRDDNGVAWVNPMVHTLWHANADLAVEAAGYGFDEIQYDYVRFPTDGDFSTMDFGIENTQANREEAIEGFLALAREKLLPTGVKQSADVFGYTLLVDDDLGIGQNFADIAELVDYISPMVYPSHWPNGSLAVDGHPNDFPYETIEISMRRASQKLDGDMLKVRPWLQDFSFFDLMPYGDAEVRAQIDAAEAAGVSGWMLWDPNNTYHPGALEPDPDAATPVSGTPQPDLATPVTSATPEPPPATPPSATPGPLPRPATPVNAIRRRRTRGGQHQWSIDAHTCRNPDSWPWRWSSPSLG